MPTKSPLEIADRLIAALAIRRPTIRLAPQQALMLGVSIASDVSEERRRCASILETAIRGLKRQRPSNARRHTIAALSKCLDEMRAENK